MKPCIGLFGTCGGSPWRNSFKEEYLKKDINFYDPQKENWVPEDAVIEADHLANDAIILFPVTSETYGTGSLAEVGFSILNAIKLDDRRDFVVMIEQSLDSKLVHENAIAAKDSLRARALVKQHLNKLRLSNLYVVDNLHDMLEISLKLYEIALIRSTLTNYTLK